MKLYSFVRSAVTIFVESKPAVVAVTRAEVVFFVTTRAMVVEFTRRHGEEQTVIAADDFDISYYETVIEGKTAKGLESTGLVAEVNADIAEMHGATPVSGPG